MARRAGRGEEGRGEAAIELDAALGFMRLLWSVDHGLQLVSKRMRRELGITGPQRLALRIIGRSPGIGAGALASVLRLHPSTLTGVLRRLEARRLVRRSGDPQDSRRALFHLTGKGAEVDRLRARTVEAMVRKALARVPEAAVATAAAVLAVLAAELGAAEEQSAVPTNARYATRARRRSAAGKPRKR